MADYSRLHGPQRAAVRAAFLSAFTRDELKMLLSDRLDKRWDNYTRDSGNLQEQVYDLIEHSQAEGWIDALIREAEAQRPTNRYFARLGVTLGLMAPTQSPLASAGQPLLTLERMIEKSEITAMSDFNAVQGRICRVEAGKCTGTGFLIADDIILTNYHVIEGSDGQRVICRFDYGTKGDGGLKGREVRLSSKSNWLVATSRYAVSDEKLDASPPTDDELDFALLRLAEPAGNDLINGARRGWINLSADAPQPVKDDAVLIIQHPEGHPLAMSFGTVFGYDASHLRMRYAASTKPGSSGSPVFASNLSLVALHHAGDPNWIRTAEYNQGIPVGLIVAWLKKKAVDVQAPKVEPVLPQRPIQPQIGTLVILGEPNPPTPAAAAKAMEELVQLLSARGTTVKQWAEGWRKHAPLSDADSLALFEQRPAFIRTMVDQARSFSDEFSDLTYKLHRRFGLELDDERVSKNQQLQQSPRILWRPGGPPWPGDQPQPPGYANADPPEAFARWLAAFLGLPDADADTVIHCEHPSYETDGGHAQQIRHAVEKGLIQAVGDKFEPDRHVFAPGRLRDVLKKISGAGLNILAVHDMSVPEPATPASAIDVFRRSDCDIDATIGSCPNLIRVAVLVRTAEQFNGQLEFNAKARLRNWCLLRIPKNDDGTYTSDPDNIGFIHQQVATLTNARAPAGRIT
jgi:V8-like Glu-specific endopeptidase